MEEKSINQNAQIRRFTNAYLPINNVRSEKVSEDRRF